MRDDPKRDPTTHGSLEFRDGCPQSKTDCLPYFKK